MNNVTIFHTKAEADAIVCLSASEKMPGRSWGIPPEYCKRGSILHEKVGAICATCYVRRGRYVFDNVQSKMARRLDGFSDPRWVDAMVYLLEGEPYFRWFDTGDIQDAEMLYKIFEVAQRTPRCRQWLASREVVIVREYLQSHSIPDNLNIRLSADYIDQITGLPHIDGCTVSTVTRDAQVAGVHNCPVTFSEDKHGCAEAGCFACWERSVHHVNYLLHTESGDAAYVVIDEANRAELAEHNAEQISMSVSVSQIAPLQLTPEMERMRVDDALVLFRERLGLIQQQGGFAVQFAIGREISFFVRLFKSLEANLERLEKCLNRLRDIYVQEFKIPETTAQLWKRVVECVDTDLLAGRTTMAMLAEIGISKLDILVSLAAVDCGYWHYADDGAILLSEVITDGPFDVREHTVDDLQDIRKSRLEDRRRRETPVPVTASVASNPVPVTAQDAAVLDFDSLAAREVDEAVSGNAVVLDADVAPEDADETATAITLGGTTEITTSISEGTARDTAGNLWTVRVCNGALCGWDSTASALEITPVSSDHDAYAILQAPSTGDGIPPARQLLWFDNFVGRTRNFPLT